MSKNIILFGAGASFGSDLSGNPPLGNTLFYELAKFNPKGWGQLPQELKREFIFDFELGMKKLSLESPMDVSILQRSMAAYFFNFKPKITNLYSKLATRLKLDPKSITLSTLNYERLLEISFFSAGHNLQYGSPAKNVIEINFPHGCCNIFCESVSGLSNLVFFSGLDVTTNGLIKCIGDQAEFYTRINGDAFPPVMSYFEPLKRVTSGNNFITDQRDRFNDIILNAEKIIVIGVKIREHDRHIWEIIGAAKGKLVYCSGPSEKRIFDLWVQKYRVNVDNLFINGFWGNEFDKVYNELS